MSRYAYIDATQPTNNRFDTEYRRVRNYKEYVPTAAEIDEYNRLNEISLEDLIMLEYTPQKQRPKPTAMELALQQLEEEEKDIKRQRVFQRQRKNKKKY